MSTVLIFIVYTYFGISQRRFNCMFSNRLIITGTNISSETVIWGSDRRSFLPKNYLSFNNIDDVHYKYEIIFKFFRFAVLSKLNF